MKRHNQYDYDSQEMDGEAEEQDSVNRQTDYNKDRLKHGKSDHKEKLIIDQQNEQMEEKEDEIAKA